MAIFDELVLIISDNTPGSEGLELKMDTLLKDELGLDSLRLVQIMVAIEEKYEFEFEPEDLDPRAFERIADLVILTEKTIEKGGAA